MSNRIFNGCGMAAGIALTVSNAFAVIPNTISFTNAFMNGSTGVTIARPVFFAQVPGKESTFVVLEQQRGNAIIVHRLAGSWVKDTLVKITLAPNIRNEQGLLGLAFHPDFRNNHKYYLFYTKNF